MWGEEINIVSLCSHLDDGNRAGRAVLETKEAGARWRRMPSVEEVCEIARPHPEKDSSFFIKPIKNNGASDNSGTRGKAKPFPSKVMLLDCTSSAILGMFTQACLLTSKSNYVQ